MTKKVAAPSLHKIGWKQADHDVGLLLDYLRAYLKKNRRKIKVMAAITRGGLIPTALVAYAEGHTWVDTICAKSYHGSKQEKVEIRKDLHPDSIELGGEGGKYILFVDDLADGGATIRAIRERYPKAIVIAPYVKSKPDGLDVLDAWAVQIPGTTWYAFVWSKREKKPEELIAQKKI